MNILFIGKRFYTNRDALSEKYGRIYQLPLHWSESDHDVQLWLVDYHGKETVKAKDGKLEIISTPVKKLSFYKYWSSIELKKNKKFDIIVASGDCYIGMMGYIIAKRLKAKFLFDVYDKYDEFSGYIKPLGFDLFGFLLKKADIRLFSSQALMASLGQAKIDCLASNGVDANRFKNIEKQKARKKANLETTTNIIGYFGSMEPDRGVEDLINAVQLLRRQMIPIELVLGGKAPKELSLDIPGVRYLGNVPFDDVPYALASCDILAIPYRRSPFMDAGASNKIAEALACMRPIVATQSPNLSSNFNKQAEALRPYLATPSNPESLAEVIKKQLKDVFIVTKPENIYWNQIAKNVLIHIEKTYSII